MRKLNAKELKLILDGFVPGGSFKKPVRVYEVTCVNCIVPEHFHARDIKGLEHCLEVNEWAKSSVGYICSNCLEPDGE